MIANFRKYGIAKISLGLRKFRYAIEKFIVPLCYILRLLSIAPCFIFLLFSSLLSSWSLIYDVEFDSNSSCLDRLNNVGMISSQKLQNLPQNAISRIVGTLMCKSG